LLRRYDLQLGKLWNGQTQIQDRAVITAPPQTLAQPLFVASKVPKAWDTSAPLVRAAEAGETVAFELPDGTVRTVTAPADSNQSAAINVSLASGATVTLHLLPAMAPMVPPDTHLNTITALEDGSNWVSMYGGEPRSDWLNTTAIITSLPNRGVLYQQPNGNDVTTRANPITAVGTPVEVSIHGSGLLYVPASDSYGASFDSFSYVSHPILFPNCVGDYCQGTHTCTHMHIPHAHTRICVHADARTCTLTHASTPRAPQPTHPHARTHHAHARTRTHTCILPALPATLRPSQVCSLPCT
jgi:hypothetical protein